MRRCRTDGIRCATGPWRNTLRIEPLDSGKADCATMQIEGLPQLTTLVQINASQLTDVDVRDPQTGAGGGALTWADPKARQTLGASSPNGGTTHVAPLGWSRRSGSRYRFGHWPPQCTTTRCVRRSCTVASGVTYRAGAPPDRFLNGWNGWIR